MSILFAGLLLLFVLGIGIGPAPGVFAAPFLVVFVVLGIWVMRMKCPRCGYPLFRGDPVGHFAAWLPAPPRECRKCALSFVAEDTREEGAPQGELEAPDEELPHGGLVMGDRPEYPIRVDFYRDGELLERNIYEAEWELLTDLEWFDSEDCERDDEGLVFDRHGRPVRLKVEATRMVTFELAAGASSGPEP